LVLINSESEVQKPQMDLPEEAVPDEESKDGELKGKFTCKNEVNKN
jgi:hypothetical protein